MIRFCDKEIFALTQDEIELIDIVGFLKINPCVVIGIKEDNSYVEMIHKYVDEIRYEKVELSRIQIDTSGNNDHFWDGCRNILRRNNYKLVSVFDENNEIIGFVYEDDTDERILRLLKTLINYPYVEDVLKKMYPEIQHMFIGGMNEASFYMVQVLNRTNINFSLYGDGWEWFGYDRTQNPENVFTNHSFYFMAEGIGYHMENHDHGSSLFPAVNTIPQAGTLSATLYSVEIDNMKRYLEYISVPYVMIVLPSAFSVKRYATELERQSLECNAVPPYRYISERISGKWGGQ